MFLTEINEMISCYPWSFCLGLFGWKHFQSWGLSKACLCWTRKQHQHVGTPRNPSITSLQGVFANPSHPFCHFRTKQTSVFIELVLAVSGNGKVQPSRARVLNRNNIRVRQLEANKPCLRRKVQRLPGTCWQYLRNNCPNIRFRKWKEYP